MKFAVTFGQQYPREPHPRLPVAHRDGWLTINADNEGQAREMAYEALGTAWSFIYTEAEMEQFKVDFPLGELAVLPAEQDPDEDKS